MSPNIRAVWRAFGMFLGLDQGNDALQAFPHRAGWKPLTTTSVAGRSCPSTTRFVTTDGFRSNCASGVHLSARISESAHQRTTMRLLLHGAPPLANERKQSRSEDQAKECQPYDGCGRRRIAFAKASPSFIINLPGHIHKRVSHGHQFLLQLLLFLLAQLQPSSGVKLSRSVNDGCSRVFNFRLLEFLAL